MPSREIPIAEISYSFLLASRRSMSTNFISDSLIRITSDGEDDPTKTSERGLVEGVSVLPMTPIPVPKFEATPLKS